jgi:uncharacterized membrane protein
MRAQGPRAQIEERAKGIAGDSTPTIKALQKHNGGDEQLVLIVYLLYFPAYIFEITALVGVMMFDTFAFRTPLYSLGAITSSKSGRSGSQP